ncbi:OPT-domain-containing protein [Atractiella rhizophila]|nr:OPT-domain-containing protein [Atractiella rhizophila]
MEEEEEYEDEESEDEGMFSYLPPDPNAPRQPAPSQPQPQSHTQQPSLSRTTPAGVTPSPYTHTTLSPPHHPFPVANSNVQDGELASRRGFAYPESPTYAHPTAPLQNAPSSQSQSPTHASAHDGYPPSPHLPPGAQPARSSLESYRSHFPSYSNTSYSSTRSAREVEAERGRERPTSYSAHLASMLSKNGGWDMAFIPSDSPTSSTKASSRRTSARKREDSRVTMDAKVGGISEEDEEEGGTHYASSKDMLDVVDYEGDEEERKGYGGMTMMRMGIVEDGRRQTFGNMNASPLRQRLTGTGTRSGTGRTGSRPFSGAASINSLGTDMVMEEEDSPYPEVRASVSNIDDPEMPALTFRTWFLGIFLVIVAVSLNIYFILRYPAPLLTPIVVQIVAYPLGKGLAYILPTTVFKVPRFLQFSIFGMGAPEEFSFNPGPFNIKEHTAIIIMANASIAPAFALTAVITIDKFYGLGHKFPVGFDFLFIITTQIAGFGFAGLCRRFLVWPGSLVWPQNLVTCTLLNTFHAEEDDGTDGKISRYRLFLYVGGAAFIWFFVPAYLFQALSVFSWVCWIWPKHRVVNQLFGLQTGLGMSGLTFDWSQIVYIGSPLVAPWWAEVNIIFGFLFFYWFLVPLLYYTKTWFLNYLPMSSFDAYDRYGAVYDVSKVIDDRPGVFRLNETAYMEYSPLYISGTYAIVYCLAFTLATASLVHTILYHGKSIINKFKNVRTEEEDVHAKLMRYYPEVPDWWYGCVLVIMFVLSVVCIEIYNTDLPVWALCLSLLLAAIYVLPAGYIFAMTAQPLTINLVAEVIPGFLFPGLPIANMVFKIYSVQSLLVAITFIQDLKLGHYMKVPPRVTFLIQIVATLIAGCVQIGVKEWLKASVHDLCSPDQRGRLVCPQSSVFYTASIIWGLIGPARQFGKGALYNSQLYFLLVGVFLPIPFYFASKRWPNSWVKYVNIPVSLVGASYIPPATGINYSSWFLVGFIFQYYLRRHQFRWWSKFNFVVSAAMDSGTIVSGIFIFLVLLLPKSGSIWLDWWGNTVFTKTYDAVGVPLNDPPPDGFGPTEWK